MQYITWVWDSGKSAFVSKTHQRNPPKRFATVQTDNVAQAITY